MAHKCVINYDIFISVWLYLVIPKIMFNENVKTFFSGFVSFSASEEMQF